MDKSDGEDSCGTSAKDVFQKLGHSAWSSWGNGRSYCGEGWSWDTEHQGHKDGSESWDGQVSLFDILHGSVHVEHELTICSLDSSLDNWFRRSWFLSLLEVIGNNSLVFLNLFNLKSDLLILDIFGLDSIDLSGTHFDSLLETLIDDWLSWRDSTEILGSDWLLDLRGGDALHIVVLVSGL